MAPLPAATGTRLWFAIFLAWMCGWTAVALWAGGTAKGSFHPGLWLLALMCFYLALCNSLLPLPTAWIVLLAAAPDFAPTQTAWLRVALVALLATLATVVANLNEYHLLAYLLRFRIGQRIRRARLYAAAVRWFDRAPFQLLTLIAFIPIPVDAVRWLAILRGYPRGRFALAYLCGRGPRYALFAGGSVLLQLTTRQIALLQLALIAAAVLGRLLWFVLRRRGARPPARSASETTIAAAIAEPPNPSLL